MLLALIITPVARRDNRYMFVIIVNLRSTHGLRRLFRALALNAEEHFI